MTERTSIQELPLTAQDGPADPTPSEPAPRPVFARLVVDRSGGDPVVEVALTVGERRIVGHAGLAPTDGVPHAAAVATLEAVRQLLPDHVEAEIGWLDVVDDLDEQRPRVVHSAVRCTVAGEEQIFLGSALASGDAAVAAVRATLDALNRPMVVWRRLSGP